MALQYWTNQTVEMQSALGTAQALTAATKGANCQLTTSGTPPANGNHVLCTVVGMRQIHQRVFKVSGVAGSNFNINVDSSAYDTFISGSFQVITFGNSFNSVRDIAGSGGDAVTEDITTVHDADDIEAIVSSSPQGYSWTLDWDPSNAALQALNTAFVTRTPRAFRFGDPSGSSYLFYGTVVAPLNPTVSGKKKVTPVSVRLLATGTAAA
jgi:hypothetical protein